MNLNIEPDESWRGAVMILVRTVVVVLSIVALCLCCFYQYLPFDFGDRR